MPPVQQRAADWGERLRLDPEHHQVIGFVGRIVRDKGGLELLEAWHALRREDATRRLLLVGPVEQGDSIGEEALEALRGDERVVMTGFVEDPAPLYLLMDVMTMPSHREGFGNALLEASAMGLPVVSTWATGTQDVVADGETGTLVPVGDATALAWALRRYLEQPELARIHGEAGRRRAREHFDCEEVWDEQARLYLEELAWCVDAAQCRERG